MRAGRPVWYLVPDGVVQYIEKRGLYREGLRRRAPAAVSGGEDPGPDIDTPSDYQEVPR